MKYGATGFTLLEMVIALALTALLGLLAAQWVAELQVGIRKSAQRTVQLMALQSAQQLLIRDIQQAAAHRKEWQAIAGGSYAWHTSTGDISWLVEDTVLYRLQGHYDAKKRRWTEHKKNRVAAGVRQCVLQPLVKNGNAVVAVEGKLVGMIDEKEVVFTFYERLYNGEVV